MPRSNKIQTDASEEALIMFFGNYSLEESQSHLWMLLKAAFSGNITALTITERSDLFSFYQNLHHLLGANFDRYKSVSPAPVREDQGPK